MINRQRASRYNKRQWEAGAFGAGDIADIVAAFQKAKGLAVDGMLGPATLAELRSSHDNAGPLLIDEGGWLHGPGVIRIASHPSWSYGGLRDSPKDIPLGVVWHYTATNPGTGKIMATRRRDKTYSQVKADNGGRGSGSWHVSIESDGSVIQQISFKRGAYHAGSNTAKPIPGIGWANHTTASIELVGHGKKFSLGQRLSAGDVLKALVAAYNIPREHAMHQHSQIDPGRRSDPGPVWMELHAPGVLAVAYD